MAAQGFLDRVSGKFKRIVSSVTSTPDAIVAMGADGLLDVSVMPAGIGPEVTVCASFENLTAGDFVNLFLSGGVIKARKANATDASKPAHGFVLANVTAPANATVYRVSQVNNALAGLTIGADYYLGTTPGAVLISPGAVASGNLNQYLGVASSVTSLVFDGDPQGAVEMA